MHNRVYRYKRLISGVSSVSEIANELVGTEGVENISDDVIIHAPDQETHDKRLLAVIKRISECGLTLNPEKCQFNPDRLVFMGIQLSQKGIKTHSRKSESCDGSQRAEKCCRGGRFPRIGRL